MREERGGGSSLRKKKSQQTARAQKAPPRRALSYLGTRGRFGAVGKCEKPCKRLEACPWRVRGGVAPGASAGRLALLDLSPEATGLGAESEGGSSGPRAPRRACPSGLRGKLQPEPGKRLPAPPHLRPPRGPPTRRHPSLPPEDPLPPPGTLCRRRPRLWGFRTAGRALILKPVPSAQPPPREVPHSEPCCGQEGVGDHAGGTPRRPRGQAFLGPGLRLKLNVDLSLVHKHFFIHPLLLPGGH